MKRMKRTAAFLLAALLVMSMAGCGKDFDAKGYVEAAMAAKYRGEYADYAKMTGMSEEEAKEDMESEFDEFMKDDLESVGLDTTDEQIEQYQQVQRDLRAKIEYEVKDAVKDDDGNYTVDVVVTPLDAYDKTEAGIQDEWMEAVENGADEDDLIQIFIDFYKECVDNAQPKDPVTITLHVEKQEEGNRAVYGIPESEQMELENAMVY